MIMKPNEGVANSAKPLRDQASHGFAGPPAGRSAAKLQILLVEDDMADAYLISRALTNNPRVGEVLLAEDGVEALELLDRLQISPNMAIVDLRMPRKDGHALLEEFGNRSTGRFPSIVLSSSKSGKDALRAAKNGAVDFITKPKSEARLRAVLDRAITSLC